MLGEVCERVTGIDLADYLKQVIFDPLGLKDTTLRWRSSSMAATVGRTRHRSASPPANLWKRAGRSPGITG